MSFALLISLAALTAAPDAAELAPSFIQAKPVWAEGRETEMNLTMRFRVVIEAPASGDAILRLAASTVYRVHANGAFIGWGPARGPHGYYRVDEWSLTPYLKPGKNVIAVEVAGYNANSYYLLDQPSFLQAEVIAGKACLAATGATGFEASACPERVQKVQRYSFQRPFSEVYHIAADHGAWMSEPAAAFPATPIAETAPKNLLSRRVPYPEFAVIPPVSLTATGSIRPRAQEPKFWKDRSLTDIGPKLKGYPENELVIIPTLDLQKVENAALEAKTTPYTASQPLPVAENGFVIADFGLNRTGFLGATINAKSDARVFLTFDEILTDNDVDFRRLGCDNIVAVDVPAGIYAIESMEPYTMRYAKLIAIKGDCEITKVYLREYKNPEAGKASFKAADERLNRLFEAGRETFAQNAVDIFMDCPSRERAGWLCDSFFTSRSASVLCGNTHVEDAFYENYMLPESFACLPKGMLPMCYPSDHNDGVFIPNWALWFVVELDEYIARGGSRTVADALKPKVQDLFAYFSRFENTDGLLEKLESWVFVEWSQANNFVQDVNYPSNMLYAGALSAAGRLYGLDECLQKADRIRETIRKQSFDGSFFVDNAIRKDGQLAVTKNHSEVCQYFAFFFNVATPEMQPELWKALRDEFGPHRKESKAYPEVHPANSFIGNMLRMELLSRYGQSQQIMTESVDYLLYMADRTGTLWENDGAYASCNHGFASHIVYTLFRDVLGLRQIDVPGKRITLCLGGVDMPFCEGKVPTPQGMISVRWERTGKEIRYHLDTPEGYTVEVQTQNDCTVVQQ